MIPAREGTMPNHRTGLVAAIAAVLVLSAGSAPGVDLHAYWENHCAECHGHSGAFARERLRVEQGRLVSDHWGRDLERFLANHHAAGPVLPELAAMLVAQVQAAPTYRDRCEGCHGPAADLVRGALVREDGILRLRTDGRPLDAFLARHGGLGAEERAALLRRLGEIAAEVGLQ
jgi:hypothetical protein